MAAKDGGAVVITGASTGIGRACALRFDSLGFRVFAGVRRSEDGDRLREEGSKRLIPVTLDVTDQDSIHAAAATVEREVGDRGLSGLVNNAGVALSSPLEFIPLEEFRRQLEVNVVGQVAVIQAFMPLLRRGRGRIVNIGSIGGRVALPFVAPYAASKFALEAITDSLRRELMPSGIEVSIVSPGGVSTEIWDRGLKAADDIRAKLPPRAEELYGPALDTTRKAAAQIGRDGMPPDRVAQVVEHALTAARPRTRYLVGRDAKLRAAMARWLPDRVFDRLVARAMGIGRGEPSPREAEGGPPPRPENHQRSR
jgi:NAD(P)-dependent dehydrogenase (short-subunit alcohol dehydrogenase family)